MELSSRGTRLDFDPLVSPIEALDKADLIIKGKLVELNEGIVIDYSDPLKTERHAGRYVTFVVDIIEKISGSSGFPTDQRIYVQVMKSALVGAQVLEESMPPGVAIALILDEWAPGDGQMIFPTTIPSAPSILVPYTDGIWLQGAEDSQMQGMYVEVSDLSDAWKGVSTIDEFISILRDARGG